jgi:hypothetical protein
MKPRGLAVLAVLAVLSVAATAAVLRTGTPTIASDRRGELVIPGLADKANDISGITIRQDGDTLSIERRDSGFVAAESGYPVKADAVRELLASAIALRFEGARTADAARYSDLGLADPGAPNAGKEIVIRSAHGDLADLVVGNRDSSLGGAAGGLFIRFKGEPQNTDPQTWLARGNVRLPASRADWLAPVELKVQRNQIATIEMSGGGRDKVSAKANPEKQGELALQDVPEKRAADTAKVGRLAGLLERFTFTDVRKRAKPAADDARRMVVDLSDGLELVIAAAGEASDGWVQLTAQGTNDAAREKAKAITAKVDGYDFHLPANQAEVLGWTMTDLTSEQRS